MIKVENLNKLFRDKNTEIFAVKDLSFACKKGEIFGLLGPNGAGKTTTLRIVATILKPTSGKVLIDGLNAGEKENPEEIRKRIGFLTGTTGLYPYLTAREILTYFGNIYEINKELLKNRIDELSQIFQMKDFLDRRIDNLSTGMKQKVSIARTIIHDPMILILDEPMGGLDIITSRTIMDFIKHSKKEGKCILFSTHVMREAELLCDEISIIHQGQLLCQAPLNDLRKQSGKDNLEDIFFHLVGEKHEDK